MLIGISGKIGSGKDTFADLLAIAIINVKAPNGDRNDFRIQVEALRSLRSKNQLDPSDCKIVKFADALKDIVCRLTGCTRAQLEDQDFKNSFMPDEWRYTIDDNKAAAHTLAKGTTARTYREFLQELGTDVLRSWIPNIHVNATFAAWKPIPGKVDKITGWGGNRGDVKVEEKYPNWIITDMRFPNELVAVQEHGGITIRINRRDDLRDPGGFAAYMIGTGTAGMPAQPLGKNLFDAAKRISHPHPSETALDNYNFFDVVIDNNGTIDELYAKALEIVNQYKLHEKC